MLRYVCLLPLLLLLLSCFLFVFYFFFILQVDFFPKYKNIFYFFVLSCKKKLTKKD